MIGHHFALQCKLYSQNFEIKVNFCIIVGVDSRIPKGQGEGTGSQGGNQESNGCNEDRKNESRKKQGHNGIWVMRGNFKETLVHFFIIH